MKANSNSPEVGPGIHLNIGCGNKLWPGFINIDAADSYAENKPEIFSDIRTLPFPNNYADSAYAIHVFEHIYRYEALDALKEWLRVLKKEAILVLELPCLDKVLNIFNHYQQKGEPIHPQMTMWALYGDPSYRNEHMVHRWCYTVGELSSLMIKAGFSGVEYREPEYHVKHRDMRMVGYK